MNLDLVISADISIAHLAGALGVPAWVAVPFAPHWTWLLEREDSPWYPTLRLFRQEERGNWKDVFARLAGAVKQMLAKAAGPRPITVSLTPAELLDLIEQLAAQLRAASKGSAEVKPLASQHDEGVKGDLEFWIHMHITARPVKGQRVRE